ncbi:hypothetical protein MPLB_1490095 [Mesorhizobium sp. ORS 3324]|nr:hypothetical protein MPLB_1490095 [Mesorhizobium sp. ORS 3324]
MKHPRRSDGATVCGYRRTNRLFEVTCKQKKDLQARLMAVKLHLHVPDRWGRPALGRAGVTGGALAGGGG